MIARYFHRSLLKRGLLKIASNADKSCETVRPSHAFPPW